MIREFPIKNKTTNDFRLIAEKSIKITKKYCAKGLNKIKLEKMDVIDDDVIIRGDLARITLGEGSIVSEGTILHPCLSSFTPPFDFKEINIGSHCFIGKNCIISSKSIGNYVQIGDNCILSDRTEIGNNVKILDNTYIPPETKLIDYAVYGGHPGKYLGEITEGFEQVLEDLCTRYYHSIVIK